MTAEAQHPDPLAGNALLRVVREQHPDIDIVVLPGAVPDADEPVASPLVLAALAADLEQYADALAARLAVEHDVAKPLERAVLDRTDDVGRDYVESRIYAGTLPPGHAIELLRSTAHAFVGLGWQVRPVPGRRPRVEARRLGRVGAFTASATVRPDALQVFLRTPSVRTRSSEAVR